jgi:hypothetical protein
MNRSADPCDHPREGNVMRGADLADAVNVDDLKLSAVVLAMFAWHAAMRDEQIRRRGQR